MKRFASLGMICLSLFPSQAAAQQREPALSEQSRTSTPVPDGAMQVHGFKITGNSAIPSDEFAELLAPYIGRSLKLAELQHVADQLTQEYRQQGYTLAKAYLPEQDVEEGIVEIAVLEGVVGEIRVVGNEHYSTAFIRRGFQSVINDHVIRHTRLEQSLLLLNDSPNLNVTASLEPGASVGSTDIVATVKDEHPIHVTVDYNNFGVPFISRNRFGAGVEVGNVLIEGSLLRLNGIIGEHPDKLLFEMGSYIVPLNRYGTKLALSGSNGRFDVGGQLASLQISGRIKTYDVSITHPLVKSRFEHLVLDVGFASKDNRLFLLGQVSGADHLRMAKAGVNYDRTDSLGRNFVSLYGFQGLGEVLGGMENNDPLPTRQGADNRFTKGTVALGRVHTIRQDVFLVLRGAGQITTGPLPIIEQFLLGGPDSVRGYQLGQHLGDEGYNVSAEGRYAVSKYVQLAAFIDHGAARVRNPAVGEAKSHSLTGAGPGIRVNLPYYETAIRVDVGFPIEPPKAIGGSFSGGSSPTVYIQATARF
jgi:hemolysin activation/secretion protein